MPVLLQDGLGDTIRVSLTEPPDEEIKPCKRLVNFGMQATDVQKGVVSLFSVLHLPFYSTETGFNKHLWAGVIILLKQISYMYVYICVHVSLKCNLYQIMFVVANCRCGTRGSYTLMWLTADVVPAATPRPW